MSKTAVYSIRLELNKGRQLEQLARQSRRTVSETAALLVNDGLRRVHFPHIDFREKVAGRVAYVRGTRVAVWQVVALTRNCNGQVDPVCQLLGWPAYRVQAALNYGRTYPQEIQDQIDFAEHTDFEDPSRQIPGLEDYPIDIQPCWLFCWIRTCR